MNHFLLTIFLVFFSISIFSGCRESYNPKLQTPDIDNAGMNHGYNLTPLGCLVYAPWNLNDSDSSNTDALKKVIFELHEDGTLKYWFTDDYLKSPTDTIILSDGNKSISHSIRNSKVLLKNNWLKNIYTSGSWKVNFNDSTIQISFGKNDFLLSPIEGKYITLGSQEMVIHGKANFRKTYFSFNHY
jgi:hypothetical protein